MSTVKATNFQHPSSAAANITLGSDGSVVLPAGFSGGLGTNVVQTVKTDVFTTTSTSYADVTGLAVSITPISATSKVLVLVSTNIQHSGGASFERSAAIQLLRDATVLSIGDAAGSRTRAAAGNYDLGVYGPDGQTIMLLDSPATASSVTYKVQMKTSNSSQAAVMNRSGADPDNASGIRNISTITAIEVAA